MSRKKENKIIFRCDDETLRKLEVMIDAQNKVFERIGAGKITKTKFFEKIIADQYILYLNQDKDPETADRINLLIDSRLIHTYRMHDKVLHEILFLLEKTIAQNKLLLHKQGVNISNTDVVGEVTTKNELENLIDSLVARSVFGEKEDEEEVVKLDKKKKATEEKTQDAELEQVPSIDDLDFDIDDEEADELSDDEITRIMNDYDEQKGE